MRECIHSHFNYIQYHILNIKCLHSCQIVCILAIVEADPGNLTHVRWRFLWQLLTINDKKSSISYEAGFLNLYLNNAIHSNILIRPALTFMHFNFYKYLFLIKNTLIMEVKYFIEKCIILIKKYVIQAKNYYY